jgi:hypothetical protein
VKGGTDTKGIVVGKCPVVSGYKKKKLTKNSNLRQSVGKWPVISVYKKKKLPKNSNRRQSVEMNK